MRYIFALAALLALASLAAAALQYAPAAERVPSAAPTSAASAASSSSAAVREPLRPDARGSVVAVAGKTIRVALADTPTERTQGLSGTAPLESDEGMLFVFDEEGLYGFWMKDMRYAIDIFWISAAGDIVHIVEHASPESYPASFVPEKPAKYVLELQAGFAEAHNIATGQTVVLPR